MAPSTSLALAALLVATPVAGQPWAPPPPPPPPVFQPWIVPPSIPDDAPAETDPFVSVAAQLGLGTPLGLAGIELGLGWRWFRASAGVGQGWKGLEWSAMLHLVRPSRWIEFGIGAGLSKGPALNDLEVDLGESSSDPYEVVNYGDQTLWTNVEVTGEQRLAPDLSMRFTLGYSMAAHVDCRVTTAPGTPSGRCTTAEQRSHLGNFPYIGAAVVWRVLR